MKKYIIFCSLLIMFLFGLIVNGASGEVYPGGYSGSKFYTTSDNLQLEYMTIPDNYYMSWYNESLLNFPYVQSFSDLSGQYYVGSDNIEVSYEISDFSSSYGDTSVSSMFTFERLQLQFGQSYINLDNSSATSIQIYLDAIEDNSYQFLFDFYCSGVQLQFINDEWIEVPFVFTREYIHEFTSGSPSYTYNYLELYSDELLSYSNNFIINFDFIEINIYNSDNYSGDITRQYIYYRKLNDELLTTSDWSNGIIFDFSDFGSSLLLGVTNFLEFEIYPGFSLLDLLYLIIGIPLLIAILRLFLGG